MRRIIIYVSALATLSGFSLQCTDPTSDMPQSNFQPTWESLAGWQVPVWFEDAVLGFYCHWGVYSVPGFAFLDPSERVDSGIWYGGAMYDPEDPSGVYNFHLQNYGDPCQFGYKDLVPLFRAENWSPDRWASLYKEAGADFVGICAEHADGFPMWNSAIDLYNVNNYGPQRDVMAVMFAAARAQNMRTIATFHEGPGSIYEGGRERCPDGVDVNDPAHADLYELSSKDELYNKLIEVIDNYQPDQMWFENAEDIYGLDRWRSFLGNHDFFTQRSGIIVIVRQE
ncbi:MAG: alpha-L-fucosidase, partial [Calditrichota bacterium]